MGNERDTCPACGSLPCDWVNDPFAAPIPEPGAEEASFDKAVMIFHSMARAWEDAEIDGNSKDTIAENAVYQIGEALAASPSAPADPVQTWRPIESDETIKGTFACPICGLDRPHHHPEAQVVAYREDQIRADGWISTAHRQPEGRGWYLCKDIEIDPEQYGPIRDQDDDWSYQNPRWSQLSWFLWVRDGGEVGDHPPDVLFYDRSCRNWRLRNLLGNAVRSGAESRFAVFAQPKYWRELPGKPSPTQPSPDPSVEGLVEGLRPFYGASCCLGGGRADSQQVVLQLRDVLTGRFRAKYFRLNLGHFRRAAQALAQHGGGNGAP